MGRLIKASCAVGTQTTSCLGHARVIDQNWDGYQGTLNADRTRYSYDFAGNRLTRDVTAATNDTRDQLYTYDGLHRLKTYDGGTLTGSTISTKKAAQNWSLDQLGNWSSFQQDDNGNGTWDLDQARAHNKANEIDDGTNNGITTTTGTNWADPTHDAAGNMTTMPQPLAPSASYLATYDAWNRLVEVKNGPTVITKNEYDGLNRRIVRDETGGGGNRRHFYYNNQWQVLEERVEVAGTINANPLAQYVYHPQYVDAIAVRFYDANTDGLGLVFHYYLQDANFNVTAVVDSTRDVIERYAYTPYGEATVLDTNFLPVAGNTSTISNELLYTGRRRDPETGLQLNRNRFYASHLGRFLHRDPGGFVAGPIMGSVGGNNNSAIHRLYRFTHGSRRSFTVHGLGRDPFAFYAAARHSGLSVWNTVFDSGYVDGANLYAGYYAMWGGLDPYGLGFWDDYWHYFWNPDDMDADLQAANDFANAAIGTGVGGLAGIGVGAAVGAGVGLAGGSSGLASGLGGLAGTATGSAVGGLIGGPGGAAGGGAAGGIGGAGAAGAQCPALNPGLPSPKEQAFKEFFGGNGPPQIEEPGFPFVRPPLGPGLPGGVGPLPAPGNGPPVIRPIGPLPPELRPGWPFLPGPPGGPPISLN